MASAGGASGDARDGAVTADAAGAAPLALTGAAAAAGDGGAAGTAQPAAADLVAKSKSGGTSKRSRTKLPTGGLPRTTPAGERLVRWRDMAATRIVRVGPTFIARPPVYRASFPAESELKDDLALPMGERVRRAIWKRLLSKWFSSCQLALIPAGTPCRAPHVSEFDRSSVMVCHDQETDLVNQITDLAQPMPAPGEFHLAQVYLELPISLPQRPADAGALGSKSRDLELDRQYPFSYAWMPGALTARGLAWPPPCARTLIH